MPTLSRFPSPSLLRATLCLLALLILMPLARDASAQCLGKAPLRGVNVSGAEFHSNRLPGVQNKDYVYPDPADFDYIRSIGANVIRLPFRWERIQPQLNGPLDPAQLRALNTTVQQASQRGLCVILDVHNYATYRGDKLGSDAVPESAFIDLWTRLAAAFPDPQKAAFDLMNEPAKIDIAQWAPIAQHTVDALRHAGADNLILVAGGRWSGAHDWMKGDPSNAEAFADFKDPLHRTWLETHQYADPGFAGVKQACVDPARLKRVLASLTDWARQHHQKLFLGEFGVAPNDDCLAALDAMLSEVDDASVWRGWTYWAMGRWWGKYPMSIQPRNGQDAPQTAVLKKYFAGQHGGT